MSGFRVQCSGCGYLTFESDDPCPRCGTLLSEGHVIGDADAGATMYEGDDIWNGFGSDQTEALGSMTAAPSIPSSAPTAPAPPSEPAPAGEAPLPEIGFMGSWEEVPQAFEETPPPPVSPIVAPKAPPQPAGPGTFNIQPPAPELPAPSAEPWAVDANVPAPVDPWAVDAAAPAAADPWTTNAPALERQSWEAEPELPPIQPWNGESELPAIQPWQPEPELPPIETPRESPPVSGPTPWGYEAPVSEPAAPPVEARTTGSQPWSPPAPPGSVEPAAPAYRPAAPHHSTFGPPAARAAKQEKRLSPALMIAAVVGIVAVIGLGLLFKAALSSKSTTGGEDERRRYIGILTSQPDFVATLDGFEDGIPVKFKFASLHGERLIEVPLPKSLFLGTSASGETPVTIIFSKDEKVTAVAHEFWVYRTASMSDLGLLATVTDPFGDVGRLAADRSTSITVAGEEKVGEYDTKIILISGSSGTPVQANIAPALNNLVVKLDVPSGAAKSKSSFRYTLSNISTTVDPEIFRVPTSYDDLGKKK